jgi:hypothetical protein
VGLAFAWLDEVGFLAQGNGKAGDTARKLFLRPSRLIRLFGVGRFDADLLEDLLRDARRFAPLLGDTIDPKMIDYLRDRIEALD